jgi:hypothetical protein
MLKRFSEEKTVNIFRTFKWFLKLRSGMTFVGNAENEGLLCLPVDGILRLKPMLHQQTLN